MIDQDELAKRLRRARENCELTQQRVSEELEVPRSAVVALEAGRRAVSSLELSRLARLYGRTVQEFLAEEPLEEDPVQALFRANIGSEAGPGLMDDLRAQVRRCRIAGGLEQRLGLDVPRGYEVSYGLAAPRARWEAVRQGRVAAEQERRRLGLGSTPLWDMAALLREQGVRVALALLPSDASGLFLHDREIRAVVLVNREHMRVRRRFSLAHEYCHVLLDANRPAIVSRASNQGELIEVRANTFAAHFLIPPEGVLRVLRSLGKGESSRFVEEVYSDPLGGTSSVSEGMQVQRRRPAGEQELQIHDVVAVAAHFGVSYLAALYQLLNTGFLRKDRFEVLRDREDLARELLRTRRPEGWETDDHWTLDQQILDLALEAHRRELISRRKALEIVEELMIPQDRRELIERLIDEADWDDGRMEVRAP